jgi:hypothetical protein
MFLDTPRDQVIKIFLGECNLIPVEPIDERHYITYSSAELARCEVQGIPLRHGKRNGLQFVLSLTPIALLMDRHARPLFFLAYSSRVLLERPVRAVKDAPPLAFPSGT